MNIPLDKVCVKSGLLCERCQAKISSGQYSPWEVEVMRVLLDLEARFKELRGATYIKSVKVGDVLYVLLSGISYVSRDLAREIRQRLSIGVRSVNVLAVPQGGFGDVRGLLGGLLNAPLLSLSTYYSPDGTVTYIARVPLASRARVQEVEAAVKQVFRALTGAELYIEYEAAQQASASVRQLFQPMRRDELEKALDRITRG